MPVPGRSWVVMELRNEARRKVVVVMYNYDTHKVVWVAPNLPEAWWINLTDVSVDYVCLTQFESTDNPDRTGVIYLTTKDGSIVPPPEIELVNHTNQSQFPFQYVMGEPEFETVKKFLSGFATNISMGVEYLELTNHVLISYYEGVPGSYTNSLACFSRQGKLLWQEQIGMNLKGIGINTFFMVAERIFFVKNRSELVTFRIV